MMVIPAFEGLLVPERGRRKAARDGGFCVPAYQERLMEPSDAPFLVTNARRSFIQPGVSKEGLVRFGFSECSLEEEAHLLGEFVRALGTMAANQGWANRCSTLSQAKLRMESFGLLPRTLIVPVWTLSKICGQDITLEDARNLTAAQGYVTQVDDIRVMYSELPEGQMILATSPPMVGIYSRIDDQVGMLFRKINQTVILINELAR